MWFLLLLSIVVLAEGFTPRIIGGSPTVINKHPYQVSIQYEGIHHCGGSIISNVWILTAAHCIYGKNMNQFKIRMGTSYTNQSGIMISGIKTILYHEYYDEDTFEYDVALIKLPSPITFNSKMKPIKLASSTLTIETGSVAHVTGWGDISTKGDKSHILQILTAPIIDQNVCRKAYEYVGSVTSDMLCAGYVNGGKDTCQGDSGGPLVYNGVQIGIVSWGAGCAKPGYPGVYARVSTIRTWITKWTGV